MVFTKQNGTTIEEEAVLEVEVDVYVEIEIEIESFGKCQSEAVLWFFEKIAEEWGWEWGLVQHEVVWTS